MSKKFNFVTKDVQKVLAKSSVPGTYKVKGTNNVSLNDLQIGKAQETFEDLVISKWFKSYFHNNPKGIINLRDIENLTNSQVKYYSSNGEVQLLKDGENISIDLTNDTSLANFKLAMENNILPYLKREFSDNQFIKGLIIRKAANQKNRTWISTKVRMNKLNDPKNLDLLFQYQKDFDKLVSDNVNIELGQNSFNVADLFYLYNLIVNKDKFGSDRLTKLFGNYVSNPNNISRNFYKFYSDIDSGEEQLFDELMPLDSNMEKVIEFGILSSKGKLKISSSADGATYLELPNPNFTLITSLNQSAPSYKNKSAFYEILKYINNKNLLIQFNCE